MGKFLTYSNVDTAIQRRMANQAPDSTRRLEAINDSILSVYSEFDIDSARRDFVLYATPDGRPIYIESSVTDFNRIADLRYLAPSKHKSEYVYRDDDEFAQNIGRAVALDEYSVSYEDGNLMLKVNSADGVTHKQLHGMSSLTNNGTWSADETTSDATGITTDEVTVLEQSEAVKFNIDVSQSANDYSLISNSDMSAVDLSDYTQLGRIKFWIYITSVTSFTSVTLRWGSSDSVYWEKTVTVQSDNTALADGWNHLDFDWASATETGSVDEENIDYLAVKLNYATGYTDQAKVVIEKIDCILPIAYKFVYFTHYVSRDSSGTMQEEVTATSGDELLIPKRYKDLIVLKSLIYLAPQALGDDAEDQIVRWSRELSGERKKFSLDIGNKPKTSVRKLKMRNPVD